MLYILKSFGSNRSVLLEELVYVYVKSGPLNRLDNYMLNDLNSKKKF